MTSNVTAVILSQEDWREHDVMITLYTRERGKLKALAKGLRKKESKLASHLEPLTTAEIFMVQGKHWPIIAGSSVDKSRVGLQLNFNRLVLAGAAVNLVKVMTPLESHDERIYILLQDTLTIIEENNLEPSVGQLVVSILAWKIMILSGYRPELKRCLQCHRPSNLLEVCLDARRGGTVHRACLSGQNVSVNSISEAALKGLAYMAEAPINHVPRLRGGNDSLTEMSAAIYRLVEERYDQSPWFTRR